MYTHIALFYLYKSYNAPAQFKYAYWERAMGYYSMMEAK